MTQPIYDPTHPFATLTYLMIGLNGEGSMVRWAG